MVCTRLLAALCFSCCCTTAALADTVTSTASEERASGVALLIRTVLSLPFKGVVCVAGLVSVPAAYIGSGLDPGVRNDVAEIRHHYCSGEYFLSPAWEGE